MQIAVLGTGTMGAGMTRSLLREGLDVRVWNRSIDKAAALADEGATVAVTAREAVEGADVVVTMLFDADSVISVVADVADAFGPDTVWLQSSTVGLDGTQRVAALANEHGLSVLDVPVLGTKKPAEEGALVMLASGDHTLLERVQPALDAMGSKTIWAGDSLGDASGLKLAGNAWVASVTAGVAQSLALAGALGLDATLFLDAISGGATDTAYAHVKGAAMLSGEFPAAFALSGVVKDLGLIRSAAEGAGVNSVVIEAVQQAFQHAADAGHGSEDMAAVYTAFTPS